MSDRRLLFFISLATSLLCAVSGAAPKTQSDRPNIVFLFCDDLRYDGVGANGNPIIETPNLDKLAEAGLSFDRAFVTSAICVTSRASIMNGQYAARSGWRFGKMEGKGLSPEQLATTYHGLLQKGGYQVGYVGKYHIGRSPEDFFDFNRAFEGQGQFLKKAEPHLTAKIGDQSMDALEYFSLKDDQPFMLTIGFKAPHVQDGQEPPFYPYDEALTGHLYADIEMPPPALDDEAFFQSQPAFIREGLNRIRWRWRLQDPEQYQQSVKGYYRLVSGVDHVVGRVLEKLEALGLSDNTIVVFSSDHGVYLGDRGLAGKWLAHEASIHVPLIVLDPRVPSEQRGTRRNEMALLIDLAPTFLDWAGLDAFEPMQGVSFAPIVRGEKPDDWRTEFFYDHYYRPDIIPASEAVRTERWKYIRYVDREPLYEELYDLRDDPLEANNLAAYPEYAHELSVMQTKWAEWRERVR